MEPYVKKYDKNGVCVNELKKGEIYTQGPSQRKEIRMNETPKKNRMVILGPLKYITFIQKVFNKKQGKVITIEHTRTETSPSRNEHVKAEETC